MVVESKTFIEIKIVIDNRNISVDLGPIKHNAWVILTEVKVTSIVNASKNEGPIGLEGQKVDIAANKPIKPERLTPEINIEHDQIIGC